MQVFLIRHPRPLLAAGICYGQLDVAAEDPLPLAARLRTLLPAGIPVVSSPLQRARCLAEALHPQPQFDARLMEISFGEWEGRRWSEIDRPLLDAWAADIRHFTPPGGESATRLQARVIDYAASLTAPPPQPVDRSQTSLAERINSPVAERSRSIALITHSGVMRALLGHWLNLPIDEWSQLKFDFGHATLIEFDNGHTTLRYTNR